MSCFNPAGPAALVRACWFVGFIIAIGLAPVRGQDGWTAATAPVPGDLFGVCYGGNQLVAVGAGGTILTSADATTWVARTSSTTAGLEAVCWGDGLFVAVGENGTVVTSPDAITWTVRSTDGVRLRNVAHGNGRFVAVGDQGSVWNSTNGTSWSKTKVPVAGWLRGLTFGPDRFFIGGEEGFICSTQDGSVFRWADRMERVVESLVYAGGGIYGALGTQWLDSTLRPYWSPVEYPPNSPMYARAAVRANDALYTFGRGGLVALTTYPAEPVKFVTLGAKDFNSATVSSTHIVAVGAGGSIWQQKLPEVAPSVPPYQNSFTVQAFIGRPLVLQAPLVRGANARYQWHQNNSPIPGATNAVFVRAAMDQAAAGTYSLAVQNPLGSTTVTYQVKAHFAPSTAVDSRFETDLAYPGVPSYFALPSGKILAVSKSIYRMNADGTWDLSYAPRSIRYTENAVMLPNGELVVGPDRGEFRRLRPDGSLAGTFPAPAGAVVMILPLADGRMLCLAWQGWLTTLVTRLHADGSPDPSYAPVNLQIGLPSPGYRTPEWGLFLTSSHFQPDDYGDNHIYTFFLTRFRADGTVDANFSYPPAINEGVVLDVRAVGDRVYVARSGASKNDTLSVEFLRLTESGAPDPTYPPIVLTGTRPIPRFDAHGGFTLAFTETGRERFLQYDAQGKRQFESTIAIDRGEVYHCTPLPNGDLLLDGTFADLNGVHARGLARVRLPQTSSSTRLANLSVRTTAGSGDQTLIAGFVVKGSSTSRSVLVRAAGPSLVPFGIPAADVVADPTLVLFRKNQELTSNDNWNGTVEKVADALGAFPFASGSQDAAVVATLEPGAYTAHVRSNTGRPGIALIELYDADPAPANSNTPRLGNVSGRAHVGTGNDVLIAGFVITGDATKRVLVRGIGPGLQSYGVSNVLENPTLEIRRGLEFVTGNDDWQPSDAGAFASVGAFTLPAGSRDAAVVADLPPGVYTAVVRGVGDTTGNAMVEVYEVP